MLMFGGQTAQLSSLITRLSPPEGISVFLLGLVGQKGIYYIGILDPHALRSPVKSRGGVF